MNIAGVSVPSRVNWALGGLLLLGYWAAATASVTEKCTTYDEIASLTAGCTYWRFNDYRLNPENGNLPQRWCALPAVLSGNDRLPPSSHPAWRDSDVWTLGAAFFYDGSPPLEAMLFRGRAAAALFGVGTALVVWLWSRALWGDAGGLLSLAACVLCPTMLAHGPLMTADMCVTLFLLAGLTAIWGVLHRIDLLRFAGCSLLVGCLFLSKLTAVFVLPMTAVLVAVRLVNPTPLTIAWKSTLWQVRSRTGQVLAVAASAAVCTLVSAAMVWLSCGFRYSAFNTTELPDGRFYKYGSLANMDEMLPDRAKGILAGLDHGRILPQAYLYGGGYVLAHRVRLAFFRGEHSINGWWMYFPYCFLVKTPWPLFALLALAAFILGVPRMRPQSAANSETVPQPLWYRTAPLWTLWGVYWTTSLLSSLNIGHRHLLPTYPPLYILAGAAAGWLAVSPRLGRCLLIGVLLWSAADTATAFPHYLAYFNPLLPAKVAYRSLVDSNLDWGQDLPGLKNWLSRENLDAQEAVPVYLSYFGKGRPEYYGIHALSLQSEDPDAVLADPLRGGVFCISATNLQGVYLPFSGPWNEMYESQYCSIYAYVQELRAASKDPDALKGLLQIRGAPDVKTVLQVFYQIRHARLCAFLRHREPNHEIGYSILIYRLSDEDVDRAVVPRNQ